MFDYETVTLFWVNRLGFSVRKELAQRFGEAGFKITAQEWAILLILWKQGEQTPSDLAKVTFRDRTTVTRLIDRMVRGGLVERTEHPSDRRKQLLRPTGRGMALRDDLVPIAAKLLAEVHQAIPAEHVEITVQTLRAMTLRLDPD